MTLLIINTTMYFNSKNIFTKKTSQKKRYNLFPKPTINNLRYSGDSIVCKNKMFLELNVIKCFMVTLKRLVKKKNKTKVYLYLKKNHIFSNKTKNSRMGKGKGRFNRFAYKTKTNLPLLSVFNLSKYRFLKLKKLFFKKLPKAK